MGKSGKRMWEEKNKMRGGGMAQLVCPMPHAKVPGLNHLSPPMH